MMKHYGFKKPGLLLGLAGVLLLSGCATQQQVDELTQRVEALEAETASATSTATAANASATEAAALAEEAKRLAEDAAQCCVDTNAKIDRLFHRSQLK